MELLLFTSFFNVQTCTVTSEAPLVPFFQCKIIMVGEREQRAPRGKNRLFTPVRRNSSHADRCVKSFKSPDQIRSWSSWNTCGGARAGVVKEVWETTFALFCIFERTKNYSKRYCPHNFNLIKGFVIHWYSIHTNLISYYLIWKE